MTLKCVAKSAFILFSIATAVCGFRAARLWYLSSLPAPDEYLEPKASINDNVAEHTLNILVNMQSTQRAVATASLLNKRAAKWSAWTPSSTGEQ